MQLGPLNPRTVAEHPARFVVLVFALAIAAGTGLLLLPWSTVDGASTSPLDALFTSTSAICVTGLAVVDTGSHWSGFGQGVLVVLMQLGGLGFMTIASLIAIVVSRRLGLRMTLIASQERSALTLGDFRRVLKGVAIVTVLVEVAVTAALTVRYATGYGYGWGTALWHGIFHSVAAFNNAGFGLEADSLVGFQTDVVITGSIAAAIVIGGLGFPVLVDLYEHRRDRRWPALTLHSRITLVTTVALLVAGTLAIAVTEWRNPGTLGTHGTPGKVWLSIFGSVTPRTAGFNTIDVGAMTDEGLFSTMVLMFIGAGSAGTSGGIKVGTFAILSLVVWSQLRGRDDVVAYRRRLSDRIQREAVTVVLLGVTVVSLASMVLLGVTDLPMRDTFFEAISAFGTVGLSTGITPDLPGLGQVALVVVMLIGRVGPVTLGMALVLKQREARLRYPEEAPLVG